MDINVKSLLVFRDLAHNGSFSETARMWGLSQPTISQLIGRLESSVELVLFERGSAGVRLTPAGERMLERSNEVCDAYLAFVTGVDCAARRTDRVVRIAFDRSWFGERMEMVFGQATMPEGIQCVACEALADLWDGLVATRHDIVIASRFLRAGLSPGIQEAVIRHERGITVAWNPAFYDFDPARFSFPEILRTSVLLPDARCAAGFASLMPIWCEHAYGRQPANTVTFAHEEEAAIAAAAGLGVMLGPGDVMARLSGVGQDLLHVRTFEFLLPEAFTFGVYCRSDESSKDVLSVATALGSQAIRLIGGG